MTYPEEATSGFAVETITVATTAIGFTLATMRPTDQPGATRAVCTLETAQIRYWPTGNPTSTVGHILNVGDTLIVEGLADLNNIRFIRTGGTSGVLQVSFER